MIGRGFGAGAQDLRCHFATCPSTLGKQWRGVVASSKDLWDRIETRVCEDHIKIINEGEQKSGWILRLTDEGWLWFDTPWAHLVWGGEVK